MDFINNEREHTQHTEASTCAFFDFFFFVSTGNKDERRYKGSGFWYISEGVGERVREGNLFFCLLLSSFCTNSFSLALKAVKHTILVERAKPHTTQHNTMYAQEQSEEGS